jgi:microcystin degradation protein MlrC
MRPRVAAAQLSHETNVFSAVPTDLAAFQRSGLLTGAEIVVRERGTNSAFGGFFAGAAERSFELLPIVSVWATPSGMVRAETFDALTTRLLDGLAAAAPLDGVLLALHGAMVSEKHRDADGEILRRVRGLVGTETPIVATLDLHANISKQMAHNADVLIGYDTYPHVDMAERAEEACAVLSRLMSGELHADHALEKPPMLPTSQRMTTDRDPMATLIAAARDAERDPRVIDVTVAGGFPPADVPEAGLSVLVTTADDTTLARQIARRIAGLAWERREQFLGGVSSFEEAGAALRALPSTPDAPLVLVDIGDNPWTGGPGDSVELVRFLLDQNVEGAAVALVADPESVKRCISAGLSAEIELSLGGKTDLLHGPPLACTARVELIADGSYVNSGPMMAGLEVDLGPSAVIAIGRCDLKVLVTSRAETPIDLNVFRCHGLEPTSLRIIGLKGKGHFRAAFEPIAREVILVEGPGITGSDLSRLPFRHIRRPIWPLDAQLDWRPEP